MLKKIKASLAYRLTNLYKIALKFKKTKCLQNKKSLNLVVLMMTGKHHLNMTRLALLSIANNWSALPKLIITTDGTITAEDIAKSLSFWPGEMLIKNWDDTVAYHKNKSRSALIRYGNNHPFGKKLAIILHHAENQPVLWIDSDILFFNDFVPYIPKNVTRFACGGTEDNKAAYHDAVLDKIQCNLYDLYSFNAGVLYVSGDKIYENFKLEDVLDSIHPTYDFLTEQTIFAYIASKSMGLLWSKDIIKNFHYDNQQIKAMPVKNVIARHYISNVRHLFWRDAFYNL
jgi:hypothetical protein